MTTRKVSRRDMLKLCGTLASGALLAACSTPASPQVIRETVEVEKTVKETVIVTAKETVVVEPTAAPLVAKPIEGNVVVMHFLHEFTEEHANAFTAENPGVTIERVDGSDMSRLFAMLAAGAPPDLVRVQAPSIPQFLARKLLMDLTPYFLVSTLVPPDDLMPFNDYYKAASALEIGGGKIYGMCKDASPDLTIFLNKRLFEEAGLTLPDETKAPTFSDIRTWAEATTKFEGDRVLNVGYSYNAPWIDRFIMVALAESGQSLYTDIFDKVDLKNEAVVEICRWYYDMAKDKLTDSPINPSPNGWSGGDFNADILAMAQWGFWFSAMAETDTNRGHNMMIPAPTWTGTRMDPTVTATGMVMMAESRNPEAAWKVFEYYNGGQPSIDRAKSGWGVPALKSQLALIPQETEFQRQTYKVLQGELALNTPPIKFNPFIGETTFSDAWLKNIDQALKNQITFEEMLANIESAVNMSIQEGIDRLS